MGPGIWVLSFIVVFAIEDVPIDKDYLVLVISDSLLSVFLINFGFEDGVYLGWLGRHIYTSCYNN